jgi:hypothetical protein
LNTISADCSFKNNITAKPQQGNHLVYKGIEHNNEQATKVINSEGKERAIEYGYVKLGEGLESSPMNTRTKQDGREI